MWTVLSETDRLSILATPHSLVPSGGPGTRGDPLVAPQGLSLVRAAGVGARVTGSASIPSRLTREAGKGPPHEQHLHPHPAEHGPGSISQAPRLPAGFTDTFSSRIVDTDGSRQHVGHRRRRAAAAAGARLAGELVRVAARDAGLAQDFTVIAVDQRGIGLTDKPQDGYDAGTLAADLIALMDALGHERFAVVGHDTGFVISYALAADHPDRVDRVALAEIPGPPGDSRITARSSSPRRSTTSSGTSRSTGPAAIPNSWSAAGRTSSSATSSPSRVATLPGDVGRLLRPSGSPTRTRCTAASGSTGSSTPRSRRTISGRSSSWRCRSWRSAGRQATATHVGEAMPHLATDVQTAVIPGAGHWVAEQAPDELLSALTPFLAPYRVAAVAATRA